MKAATIDVSSNNWLEDQIHQRNPTSRIMAFGYDATLGKAGIATMAGIRAKALQLLNELVKIRETSDHVRTMTPNERVQPLAEG